MSSSIRDRDGRGIFSYIFDPTDSKGESIRDWKHLFLTVQDYEALAAALIVFFLFCWDGFCVV